ncbi:hypothetical protein KIPB_011332 [Kipferlia bialata]|uniref:Uncharacterized protein n=1 Tax=Kipferlia bialata TaxID=797122 RepID=A0A9K3D6B6_9EUKA|nr:hypothetical protein KIPB_011332 [Kipferlia bialata]|eukprot:g11332.t1
MHIPSWTIHACVTILLLSFAVGVHWNSVKVQWNPLQSVTSWVANTCREELDRSKSVADGATYVSGTEAFRGTWTGSDFIVFDFDGVSGDAYLFVSDEEDEDSDIAVDIHPLEAIM